MAETVSPQERLQPFLLDRLTDEEPQQRSERPDRRIFTGRRFRQAVLRDLAWLLNSKSQPPGSPIEQFPEAAKSVLNYGMRDITGITASSITPADVARLVQSAILRYEPRIVRSSLQVNVTETVGAHGAHAISLEIKGEIRVLPISEPLYVKTEVDLETGRCELKE